MEAYQKQQEEKQKEDDSKSSIIILDDEKFKSEVLGSKYSWFIKFYAPWCGHCKNMAPTWNKLADKLNTSKNVRIAKYDCTKSKEISE